MVNTRHKSKTTMSNGPNFKTPSPQKINNSPNSSQLIGQSLNSNNTNKITANSQTSPQNANVTAISPKNLTNTGSPNKQVAVATLANVKTPNIQTKIQSSISELRHLLTKDTSTDCRICSKEVREGTPGLTCDICEHWIHLECTNLTEYEYDFFGNNPYAEIKPIETKFICSVCKQSQDPSTDTMVKLVAQVENMAKQNSLMQQGLATVLDLLSGRDNDSKEEVVKSVKETVAQSVEETMQISIQEALDDSKEKEEKKNNAIIFGLEESKKEDGMTEDDTKKDDLSKVNKLLRAAQGDEATPINDINQVTRLGKRKEDESARPRPVKVSFDTSEEKWQLVRNSKKIKSTPCFKDVNVHHDRTKKELNEDRALKAECTKRRNQTGLDYVIFAQKVMLRKDIDKFKEERARMREANKRGAPNGGSSY